MQYQLQPHLIIGPRGQQRLAPVLKTMTFYVKGKKVRLSLVLGFFAAHVPLAILMSRSHYVATLHVVVTIAGALWLAVSSQKLAQVAYAGAYITGAEVLWRMTNAASFWEVGKYGVAVVFVVAMIRRRLVKPSMLPVWYFVLLLPSALLTLLSLPPGESRALLSYNLSGPFALMVAACFFSQLTLTRGQLQRLFLALIGPIFGVAVVALFGMATAEEIRFGRSSSFDASGGFGPNQVSSILGLGALASFLILLDRDVDLKLKFLCGGVLLFLAAQSALTFSRGGLYNVAGAVVLASLFLLKDSRIRVQFLLAIALISALSYFVIFPRLDTFTSGSLSARFQDTATSGREDIARMDLEIWFDNLIFGVGPGVATGLREELGRSAAAHTEFTRMLAEHGIFGLVALLVFVGAAVRNLLRARTTEERALVVALMAWGILYMLNAAMRLVAPAFVFGVTFAVLVSNNQSYINTMRRRHRMGSAKRLKAGATRLKQLRLFTPPHAS